MKHPLVIVFIILLTAGCKKENNGEFYPTDSIGRINKWMLDSMRQFYYWNDALPKTPDYSKQPDDFYKSLLYTGDRFSAIVNTESRALPNSSFYRFGFHFAFVQVDGYDNYIGVITFVMPFSPAATLGLQRGTCFIQINGQAITPQNMDATVKYMESAATSLELTLTEYNTWTPGNNITISTGLLGDNPVYFTRSFNAAGKKTGYLFYNYFNETFDSDLIDAFYKLKQAGVTELILDMRYNPGGSVASSAKLSAMIADQLQADKVYAIYEGNHNMGRRGRTLQEVLQTSAVNAGKKYADLQAVNLHISRVFILTGKATASAAELVVNSLKPYITVIQIGEPTTGKDEASFVITDQRMGWELHPIVYKLFNSNNQGGYSQGLVPDYPVTELTSLPLQPIGQTSDPFVNKALQIIYGDDVPWAATDLRRPQILCKPVFSSAATLSRVMPPVPAQY